MLTVPAILISMAAVIGADGPAAHRMEVADCLRAVVRNAERLPAPERVHILASAAIMWGMVGDSEAASAVVEEIDGPASRRHALKSLAMAYAQGARQQALRETLEQIEQVDPRAPRYIGGTLMGCASRDPAAAVELLDRFAKVLTDEARGLVLLEAARFSEGAEAHGYLHEGLRRLGDKKDERTNRYRILRAFLATGMTDEALHIRNSADDPADYDRSIGDEAVRSAGDGTKSTVFALLASKAGYVAILEQRIAQEAQGIGDRAESKMR